MRTCFFMVLIVLSYSCSREEGPISKLNFSNSQWPQRWELYQTSDNTGKTYRGDAMFWQENYLFLADGTFVKTRVTEDGELSGSGTFQIEFREEETDFLLTFDAYENLIGNCGTGNQELLYILEDKTTLLSSWWACDGPGLFYRRIE